ncbi:MAG: hypothetical protein AAB588_03650 [Patescibacteria group bacterium]
MEFIKKEAAGIMVTSGGGGGDDSGNNHLTTGIDLSDVDLNIALSIGAGNDQEWRADVWQH